MSRKRPWKVYIHHDGTKTFSDDESTPGVYVIDRSRPIDGMSSYSGEDAAAAAARRVSRHGGSARIVLRDAATGAETEIRTYAPCPPIIEIIAVSQRDVSDRWSWCPPLLVN
jgi:hypothetical protein